MRADSDIRLISVQKLDERSGVEPVKSQAELFVAARDVHVIVEPPEHLGGVVDQVEVCLGIEMSKDVVGVLEHVQVLDFACQTSDLQSLLDCVRGPEMPCPRAGGKNQNSSQHGDPLIRQSEQESRYRT